MGKTQTVEFAATGRNAPTRNPRNLACTPGGSSSGSAAAVADGHVPVALGTQTGGSIMRPASYCGIYAMKPSWGLICNEGAKQFAPSLDTVGWFAATAKDLARVYSVFEPTPLQERNLTGRRIAFCRTPFWRHAEPAMQDGFARAAERIRSAGAIVSDLDLPEPFEKLGAAHSAIMQGEGAASFLVEARLNGEALHRSMRGFVEQRSASMRAQLLSAYDISARCRTAFDRIAAGF